MNHLRSQMAALLLFTIIGGPAVAQTLSRAECIQRELELIDRWDAQEKICKDMMRGGDGIRALNDGLRCMIRETTRWSEMTCNSAMRASKKNEVLILEELIQINSAAANGRLTSSAALSRADRAWKLLAEERSLGARLALAEEKSIDVADAQARAARRFEGLIHQFGGVLASPPDNGVRRYLFRGKYVTCRDHSGLTICD